MAVNLGPVPGGGVSFAPVVVPQSSAPVKTPKTPRKVKPNAPVAGTS